MNFKYIARNADTLNIGLGYGLRNILIETALCIPKKVALTIIQPAAQVEEMRKMVRGIRNPNEEIPIRNPNDHIKRIKSTLQDAVINALICREHSQYFSRIVAGVAVFAETEVMIGEGVFSKTISRGKLNFEFDSDRKHYCGHLNCGVLGRLIFFLYGTI